MKAFRKAAEEFNTYIANNTGMIPNYAERRRYGERVSTAFVESTVNVVVGKRFSKRQQMRWSRKGAHLMLQTRTRALDGTRAESSSSGIPDSPATIPPLTGDRNGRLIPHTIWYSPILPFNPQQP